MKRTLFILLAILLSSTLPAQKSYTCNVFFDTDNASLITSEVHKIQTLLDSINTEDIAEITVTAFCDERASNSYNDLLSKRRAEYLRKTLVALNYDNSLIKTQGKGELPLNSQTSDIDQQRAYNRRAEITFTLQKVVVQNIQKENDIKRKNNTQKPILTENMQVGDKVILENILFFSDMSVVTGESYDILDKLAEQLKEYKRYNIMILGHICCMPKGEETFDYRTLKVNLSVARARLVYDYLVSSGIDSTRLEYKGMKSDFPLGGEDKFDRRVEIEITSINEE